MRQLERIFTSKQSIGAVTVSKVLILGLFMVTACNQSEQDRPRSISPGDVVGYYQSLAQFSQQDFLAQAADPIDQQVEIRQGGHIIFHTFMGSQSGGFAKMHRWEMEKDILHIIEPSGSIKSWKVEETDYGLRLSNAKSSMLLKKIQK